MDELIIAGRTIRSRQFVGTGKFSSPAVMAAAVEASGAEIVTVALRRVDLHRVDHPGRLTRRSRPWTRRAI